MGSPGASSVIEYAAPHVRCAGDAALLLDAGAAMGRGADGIDEAVNARAIAAAARIKAAGLRGVRDVVPTFRSVAVHLDPLVADVAEVAHLLSEAGQSGEGDAIADGRTVEVPVRYGGEDGPDLADVAAFARCTPEDVIARHAGRIYRVHMLGFLPGFPYMGIVDRSIATPRRRSPRLRVAAGSVGIAGTQTGIYPQESPGGWQIIGRTSLTLFDTTRAEPSLLRPGDRVRFVAVGDGEHAHRARQVPTMEAAVHPSLADAGSTAAALSVTVVSPGLFTTIQDGGRYGYQDQGVPVAGPMDAYSHRVANALVGNDPGAAALEVTLLGPELRFDQPTQIAMAGADLDATLDGVPLAPGVATVAKQGSVLRCGDRKSGARAYIAFSGGIVTLPVLGSRATHIGSRLGGIEGRALKAGDRLPIGTQSGTAAGLPGAGRSRWEMAHVVPPGKTVRLRILPGPQADHVEAATLEQLVAARFTVSPQSNRMGYRLTGGPPLVRSARGDMISDATFPGALQLPPSGDPILLMADRQTTGGYPQVAMVITADLPRAGQLAPGDQVEFAWCSRAEAIAALEATEGALRAIR